MTDYEKIGQAEKELQYALDLVPEEFRSQNFADVTSWEAYLKGKLPNRAWTPITENGEFRTFDVADESGKWIGNFAYVEKFVPYTKVLNVISEEYSDPQKSRTIAFDAAVWAVRADNALEYFWYLKHVKEDLLAVKLSGAGWTLRIIGSILLLLYYSRLGNYSSSLLGFLSDPFEYSLWFLLWFVLWSPIYFAFKRSKDNRPKADEIEQKCQEVARVRNFFLEMQSYIPFAAARHRSGADADAQAMIYIVNLIDQGRANNLAEAQNIYEQDKQAYLMNSHYEDLQRKMDYNNRMTTINTVATMFGKD